MERVQLGHSTAQIWAESMLLETRKPANNQPSYVAQIAQFALVGAFWFCGSKKK